MYLRIKLNAINLKTKIMNVQDKNFNEYDMHDLSKAIEAAEAAMLDFTKTGETIIFDEQIFKLTC